MQAGWLVACALQQEALPAADVCAVHYDDEVETAREHARSSSPPGPLTAPYNGPTEGSGPELLLATVEIWQRVIRGFTALEGARGRNTIAAQHELTALLERGGVEGPESVRQLYVGLVEKEAVRLGKRHPNTSNTQRILHLDFIDQKTSDRAPPPPAPEVVVSRSLVVQY